MRPMRLETLEDRRVFAGPQLVGILPDDGHLLQAGETLNVAPLDLRFRFDQNQTLDFTTSSGVQIWRAGLDGTFTAASASTDFNTSGLVQVAFQAKALGTTQNGIQLEITKRDFGGIASPTITVAGSTISIELNTNLAGPTTAQELVALLNASPAASNLITASITSGAGTTNIASPTINYSPVVLTGANAAAGTSDLGTFGGVQFRFTATVAGTAGNGTRLVFNKANLAAGAAPQVSVAGQTITVTLNNTTGSKSTAADVVTAINGSPAASAVATVAITSGNRTRDVATGLVNGTTVELNGSNDVLVNPGYRGRGESDREIIARFQDTLPDDLYHIDIFGAGPLALRNDDGEAFQEGRNFQRRFELDLGAQIIAIVPQPIDRATNGTLSQRRNQIDVYFNNDDLHPTSVTTGQISPNPSVVNPAFYKLYRTNESATNLDDGGPYSPTSISYDPATDRAVLTFATNLDQLPGGVGTYRLRVGTNEDRPPAPTAITPVATVSSDFNTAGSATIRFDAVTPGEAGDGVRVIVTRANLGPAVPPTVSVFGNRVNVVLNNTAGSRTTAQQLIDAVNGNAAASLLVRATLASGVGTTDVTTPNPTGLALTLVFTGGMGSSFETATNVGTLTAGGGVIYSSAIDPQVYTMTFPGDNAEPGHRDINVERHVPNSGDATAGVTTVAYNFRSHYGYDPFGNPLLNLITENQKQRTREVLEILSEVAGLQFVETADQGFIMATGDLRAISCTTESVLGWPYSLSGTPHGVTCLTPGTQPAVILDNAEFWNDQYGASWFQRAMNEIGDLLGLGGSFDLPPGTIMGQDGPPPTNQPLTNVNSSQSFSTPGLQFDNLVEPVFPGAADVVHLQYLYRPESKDIDMYRFDVAQTGLFTAETTAERRLESSLLDTNLRLWQEVQVRDESGAVVGTRRELVAQNDDYFSKDSYLRLTLAPGTYWVGVSASGNETYDPTIEDTGLGGTSQGQYDLRFNFRPNAVTSIVDATGVAFDGDADGVPGGVYNFWMNVQSTANTIFVDKSAAAGGTGSLASPRNNLGQALAAAQPGQIVRVLGNGGADGLLSTLGDNRPYELGFNSLNASLPDGSTLDVPKGVTLMIDAGAVFKSRRAAINVGSTSPTVDRSGAALQVLGTPVASVYFTSYDDATIGLDVNPDTVLPTPNNWGGIAFRNDVDGADKTRFSYESEGIFLNYVNHADIRYGGGTVVVGSSAQTINPIFMVDSRPTVSFNSITLNADAAMSANPDSFREDNFHAPTYQRELFTSDYERVGPDIHGNRLVNDQGVGNATNGLAIRVSTPALNVLETLTVPARLDDRDIVHVIGENLVVQGTPGGPREKIEQPSLALTTVTRLAGGGTLPAGVYNYRVTFVDADGNESSPSNVSSNVTVAANDRVRLNALPTAPTGFTSRLVYRSAVGGAGPWVLAARINSTDTSFIDTGARLPGTLDTRQRGLRPRLDAGLTIDPAVIVKANGAGITTTMGGRLTAEGQDGLEIVFTTLADDRYGAGGTFRTQNDGASQTVYDPNDPNSPTPGDWTGLFIGPYTTASLDHTVIAFAGGITRVEGSFTGFNPLEIHQSDARVAHTVFEFNQNGLGGQAPAGRFGRGFNEAATIFVRGAQPVIVDNILRHNLGPAISVNVNSLNFDQVNDPGRQTGAIDVVRNVIDNQGPLVVGNLLDDNAINGMVVRGETVTTEVVWDDTDIVHVLLDTVYVSDFHTYGGVRLESSPTNSLVVKLESQDVTGANPAIPDRAGFSANGQPLEIDDRIGGILQVLGQPGFPVVMTALADDTVGAGYKPDGSPQVDTNNDGVSTGSSGGPGPNPGGGGNLVTITSASADGDALRDALLGPGVTAVGAATFVGSATSAGFFTGGSSSIGIESGIVLTTGDVFNAAGPNSSDSSFGDASLAGDADLDATFGVTTEDTTFLEFDFTTTTGDLFFNFVFASDEYNEFANGTFNDVFAFYIDGVNIAFIPGTTTPISINTINGGDPIGVGAVNPQFYNNNDPSDAGLYLSEVGYDGFTDVFTATALGLAPGVHTIKLAISDVGDTSFDSAVFFQIGSFADVPVSNRAQAGAWSGVAIEQYAHDRNVETVTESEPASTAPPGSNATPQRAQFLGDLGPYEKAGDENRRLGFTVHGAIGAPSDVDVYSFTADAGTEVWFDIDRTTQSLDTVVELIDDNGQILAQSNDSPAESAGEADVYTATGVENPVRAFTMQKQPPFLGLDRWSVNPRDAGMRVVLPGPQGTKNTYHVRVRSSNLKAGDPVANLQDSALVGAGLTSGVYQLQLRLRELDEIGGSTVRYSDVRYAENGIVVRGQPTHSPLLGEAGEIESQGGGANNTIVASQNLGNLLNSDRGAISVAGEIQLPDDVDWYQIDVNYENVEFDTNALLAATFDIDYADGMARPDTFMAIFNSEGRMIYVANDSNVAEDRAGPLEGADSNDLSRGSFGALDPYAGSINLPEGRYFVAVSSVARIPAQLDQFLVRNAANPLFRLEPNNSLVRIAEDHIEPTGVATAQPPIIDELLDDGSPVPFHLGDVTLYINWDNNTNFDLSTIEMVDPFTGAREVELGTYGFDIGDIAFRSDSQIYAMTLDHEDLDLPTTSDAESGRLLRVDWSNGQATVIRDDGIATFEPDVDGAPVAANLNGVGYGVFFQALTYTPPALYQGERMLAIGHRSDDGPNTRVDQTRNILYQFFNDAAQLGEAFPNPGAGRAGGAWTDAQELGRVATGAEIDTSQAEATTVAGPATIFNVPDGLTFSINDGFQDFVFEFDAGPEVLQNVNSSLVNATPTLTIRDGYFFLLDPDNDPLTTGDETLFQFDTGSVIVVNNVAGIVTQTVSVNGISGVTETYEFVRDLDGDGSAEPPLNSLAIPIDITGNLNPVAVAGFLVDAINAGSTGVVATAVGSRISLLNENLVAGSAGLGGSIQFVADHGRAPVLEAVPGSALVDGQRFQLQFAGSGTFTFEFDNNGFVNPGNFRVPFTAISTVQQVAASIQSAIATSTAPAVPNPPQLVTSAPGALVPYGRVVVNGQALSFLPGTSPIVDLTTVLPTVLMRSQPNLPTGPILVEESSIASEIGEAVEFYVNCQTGFSAASDAARINFPGPKPVLPALNLRPRDPLCMTTGKIAAEAADFRGVPVWLDQGSQAGVSPGNFAVPFWAHDNGAELAVQMASAINSAQIPGITAFTRGATVTIDGLLSGSLTTQAPLRSIGQGPGGFITGMAAVNNQMWAVSDTGGLYRLDIPLPTPPGYFTEPPIGREIPTTYIQSSADDLLGIEFAGLTAGPAGVENGRYANMLFAIDRVGRLYAFNTAGELQPIFVDGQTSIDTGISGDPRFDNPNSHPANTRHLWGVQGLAFGPLQRNLWAESGSRGTDLGHGIDPTYDQSRVGDLSPTAICNPPPNNDPYPECGNLSYHFGTGQGGTYNFPGGAYGTLVTNEFSLKGYASADAPMMYVNYFSANENAESPQLNWDSFRVFIGGDDGQWDALNINYETLGGTIWDSTGGWRQLRLPLAAYAGEENLRIRFEFQTSGDSNVGDTFTTGEELRAVAASQLRDGQTFQIDNETFEFDLGYTLVPPTSAAIVDGETVTIGDGVGTPVTYEFDKDGQLTNPAHVRIVLSEGQTAADVARLLAQAVTITGPVNVIPRLIDNRLNLQNATSVQQGLAPGQTQLGVVLEGNFGVSPVFTPVPIHSLMTRIQVANAIDAAIEPVFHATTLIADDGLNYQDGDAFQLSDGVQLVNFEFESGVVASLPLTGGAAINDGDWIKFYNSTFNAITLEFDNDNALSIPGAIRVPYLDTMNRVTLARAVQTALLGAVAGNPSIAALGLANPRVISNSRVQFGGVSGIFYKSSNPLITFVGEPGVSDGVDFRVPGALAIQVPGVGGAALQDGETFTITQGAVTETFELDSNGILLTPGARAVAFTAASTAVQVATAIRASVLVSGLGLTPATPTGGLLDLNTDSTYTATLGSTTTLSLIGNAGAVVDGERFTIGDGTVFHTIELDSNGLSLPGSVVVPFTATDDPDVIAAAIAAAIQSTGLAIVNPTVAPLGVVDLGETNALVINRATLVNIESTGAPGGAIEPVFFSPSSTFDAAAMGRAIRDAVNASALSLFASVDVVAERRVELSGAPVELLQNGTVVQFTLDPPLRFEAPVNIVKQHEDLIRIIGHTVNDPGPLGLATGLPFDDTGDFNSIRRVQNNAFEGIYIDDIIIGFAERGELVTAADTNTAFISTGATQPPNILQGPYQLEIRRSAEFGAVSRSFDTNARHNSSVVLIAQPGARIVDGQTFTLSDGVTTVVFEYDDQSILPDNPAFGVEPGRVAIPFNPSDPDDLVARTIRDAINGPAVQSALKGVAAALSDGVDGVVNTRSSSDNRINLTGPVSLRVHGIDVPEGNDTIAAATPTGIVGIASNNYRASGQIGDNPAYPLSRGQDVDLFQMFLNAGETVSIDVDAAEIGSTLNSVLAVFNANGTALAFNNNGRGPGELFSADSFVSFTATVAGFYYVGVSGFNGIPVAAPFSVYDPTVEGSNVAGSTGFYELEITFGDPSRADFTIYRETGDENRFRDQGQVLVYGNRVSNSSGWGILVDNGVRENGANEPHQGPVRQLRELNTDNLAPGVVVMNNLVVANGSGGILFSGDPNTAGADAPLPFGRIVNNTVFGTGGNLFPGGTPGDIGIRVEQNASPTLLNNVVANLGVGVSVDGTSTTTVVGGTLYQGNAADTAGVAVQDFPIALQNTEPLFVDAARGNFYPASGSRTIDSSIDSLLERAALESVRTPLGIPPSPILAPERDLFGLLRVDDSAAQPPQGFGQNVFKDRGAIDRADFSGPVAGLVNPKDEVFTGDAPSTTTPTDRNGAETIVQLPNSPVFDFAIQLVDGVEPADPVNGVGVDDLTVSANKVVVIRDSQLLVNGIDYAYSYDATNNVVHLTPLAGLWDLDRVYYISLVNRDQFSFAAPDGSQLVEGQTFVVGDGTRNQTFEFDSGYVLQVPTTGVADTQRFSITNGANPAVTFEFDRNNAITAGNVRVTFTQTSTQNDIADAIVAAVNGVSGLGLTARNVGGGRVHLGGTSAHVLNVNLSSLTVSGAPGTLTAGAIGVPFVPGFAAPSTTTPAMTDDQVGAAIVAAVQGAGLTNVRASTLSYTQQGADVVQVIIRGADSLTGFNATFTESIRDLAGNDLKANQANGETIFTVFLGNGVDYGDAPATYGTTSTTAASHPVLVGFHLGANVDAEPIGQPTVGADGDDLTGVVDDEDGVVFDSTINQGGTVSITVNASKPGVAAGQPAGFLDVFVDFNRDGDFDDATDRVFSSRAVNVGANALTFTVPSTASVGTSYARFRYSSTGGLSANGAAIDGEVEDYQVTIGGPPWQNIVSPMDVNNDGHISPIDVLLIINFLNANPGVSALPVPPPYTPPGGTPIFPDNPGVGNDFFLDVSGDNFVAPIDALTIINLLNSGGGGEGEFAFDAQAIDVSAYGATYGGEGSSSAAAVDGEFPTVGASSVTEFELEILAPLGEGDEAWAAEIDPRAVALADLDDADDEPLWLAADVLATTQQVAVDEANDRREGDRRRREQLELVDDLFAGLDL